MRKNAHGGTESDHENALREMGADIPEKEAVFPDAVMYLWEVHKDLSMTAKDSVSMDTVINYTKHIGLDLGRIELNAITMLDLIFRKYIHGNG